MKSLYKAGILLFLLAVPVFIFVFLKSFGRNNYELPVYYEEGVISSLSNCNFNTGTHTIPDFQFSSHTNKSVSGDILENKITVVDFFFTSCPNICPVMSKQLSRVQEKFKDNNSVNIISITVDPEHDTPEVLQTYAERYQVNNTNWVFLTGNKEKIYSLARCGFILPVEDGDGSPEDFIHSEKFILVDGQKRIRGYYDGTDREDVDRLILEINVLLSQKS
ncbi:SCO family protein [soil metagenome]